MTILQIDNQLDFAWSVVSPYAAKDNFTLVHHDPESFALTSIDVSKIRLELLLKIDGQPIGMNEQILENIARIKKSGCTLLNAFVCRALMARPHLFPKEWADIADSDYGGSSIRFDGSVYFNKDSNEEVVLSPFVARGEWSYGFHNRLYSKDRFSETANIFIQEYTAILLP
jgi:hypothetical protein